MSNPYRNVSIRDELLFLGNLTEQSLKNDIKSCSEEIVGEIVYLVDVARIKESSISLNIKNPSKTISLDFLCITAEAVSYTSPGAIHIYNITSKCNKSHTGLEFSLKNKSTLDDLKRIKQLQSTIKSDEHASYLEVQVGDKKFEYCTKTLSTNNALIFILSKLCDLYLKHPLQMKHINIATINERATLDGVDSLCLLFGVQSSYSQSLPIKSEEKESRYNEQQEQQEKVLRETVKSIQSKNAKYSLQEVEQEMLNQIDKSESMILEHLLEMEVNQSREVSQLISTVGEVSEKVNELQEWLYKHNVRLGTMTHSLQTIAEENSNLTEQKKNHEALATTIRSLLDTIILDTENQAILASVDTHTKNFTQECIKWGRTAYDFGVTATLKQLPVNNPVNVMLKLATKLQQLSVAHNQSLNGVSVAEMNAVKNQTIQNVTMAQQFFTTLSGVLERFLKSESVSVSIIDTCQHLLLVAPLLRVMKQYNEGLFNQMKMKVIECLSTVFARLIPSDSGKYAQLPLCDLENSVVEMRSVRDAWQRATDDVNAYSVAVAVEKLLCFLLPINECVELLCLELFSDGDFKTALESRSIESFMQQIMVGVSEALRKVVENENRSLFNLISHLALLTSCMQQSTILLQRSFLYNVLEMARQETVQDWDKFSREVTESLQTYSVVSRYCGILQPVKTLPAFVDRLIQAEVSCSVIQERMLIVLTHDGPSKNEIRNLHHTINGDVVNEAVERENADELKERVTDLLLQMTKKIQSKVEEIAGQDEKYRDLIRMENFYFLFTSLSNRQITSLDIFLKECDLLYKKSSDAYCISAIRYSFNKYVDFVLSTRQTLLSSTQNELKYVINKATFIRAVSLGKTIKSISTIRSRVVKHICAESSLLSFCWEQITSLFVGMAREIERWAYDGYEGLVISPSADELFYELNQMKSR